MARPGFASRVTGWWITMLVCDVLAMLLLFVAPLSVKGISAFVKAADAELPQPLWWGWPAGYWWVFAGLAATFARSWVCFHGAAYFKRLTFRCVAALEILIYRKALALTPEARKRVGNVHALVSSCPGDVGNFLATLTSYIAAPVQVGIAISGISDLLGTPAALVALAVTVLCVAAVAVISRCQAGLHRAAFNHTEARVHVMTELLAGVRVVKLLGLEALFTERVTAARSKEVAAKRSIAWCASTARAA